MSLKLQQHKYAKAADNFLNNGITWAAIAVVLTIYALFIDDLRLLYFPKTSDPTFVVINWIILFIFLLEWIIDSIVRPEYFKSLTSLLDLLAALSLVPVTELIQDETSVARIARTFRALRILRVSLIMSCPYHSYTYQLFIILHFVIFYSNHLSLLNIFFCRHLS